MDVLAITVICATVFGVVSTLAAFVRQLVLSRDKNLNDLAQERAFTQEVAALEKIRQEMFVHARCDFHYQIFGDNKEAVEIFDQQIEDVFKRKLELIDWYAKRIMEESSAIIANGQGVNSKHSCDLLKKEMDKKLEVIDQCLASLQDKRAQLLGLQVQLLEEETRRNRRLDAIYQTHTVLLERIYFKNNENSEHMAKYSVEASSQAFTAALLAPFKFLSGFFKVSLDVSPEALQNESQAREKVHKVEKELNLLENSPNLFAGSGLSL